jgi:hypothetical protein
MLVQTLFVFKQPVVILLPHSATLIGVLSCILAELSLNLEHEGMTEVYTHVCHCMFVATCNISMVRVYAPCCLIVLQYSIARYKCTPTYLFLSQVYS